MNQSRMSVQRGNRACSMACAVVLSAVGMAAMAAGAHGQKVPLKGLVAMGEINGTKTANWIPDNGIKEPTVHPGVYVAVDVNVTWAQLQPTKTGPFVWNAIDDALRAIVMYNNANPTKKMVAKLRLYSGANAPTWVMNLSSVSNGKTYTGPVTLLDTKTNMNVIVPLFWTYEYHQAYQTLQNALAARYDGVALIGEVSVGSCSSLSGEPFVLPVHNSTSLMHLHTAGYTDAQMQDCGNYAVAAGATGDYWKWTKTPLYFAFSLFQNSDGSDNPPGNSQLTLAYTSSVMIAFRNNYGTRAVIGNNALQDPLVAVSEVPVYDGQYGYDVQDTVEPGIHDLGRPICFQADSPNPSGGWDDVVTNLGFDRYNASEMEVWQTTDALNNDQKNGNAIISPALLGKWAGYAW